MNYDLVIANGTVIDGTGRPRFRTDLGIREGKVVAVTTGQRLDGARTLDASGLIVAPGFIDAHSHGDWILPLADHDRILEPLVLQGITTLITGQCGFSPAPATDASPPLLDDFSEMMRDRPFPYRWHSMAEFLQMLGGDGVFMNAAFLVGHGTLRYAVMDAEANTARRPSAQEVEAMCRLAREALRDGAIGLSAGLAYAPGVFASNDELLAMLRAVAGEGGLFAVHGRAYSWVSPFYTPMFFGPAHNVRSTRELLYLACQAGVRLELSHLIFVGRHTWRTYRSVLDDIERAIAEGVDVSLDAFPYTVGNSTIKVVFPDWFLDGFERNIDDGHALRRLRREIFLLRQALGIAYRDITLLRTPAPECEALEGLDFYTIAQRMNMSEFEAYMHVARASRGKARVLLGTYSGDGEQEEPLRAVLAHPRCSFMTDTILTRQGKHNPASFGTFPRVLGRYSRDLGLFSLEEAVRRMTSFPAERMRLEGIGRIAEGAWADLVLFDPKTIADHTAPGRAETPPSGIHAVLISGHLVVHEARIVDRVRHGRLLRRG